MRKKLILALLGTLIVTEGIIIADRWNTLRSTSVISNAHENSTPNAMNKNSLKIGPRGNAGPISVELAGPVEFDFKKRAEIMALRKAAVATHPELVEDPYIPLDAIYEQIVDGKPWWGEDGLFFYSRGKKSIDGLSERSRMIINPFLLIDGEEGTVPFISIHHLDYVELFAAKFSDPEFSYWPKLTDLIWYPAERKADVTYQLTTFLNFVGKYTHQPVDPEELSFDFRALNARDWGFGFVYFDLPHSINMTQPGQNPAVTSLRDFIHVGGSCGYPDGCNNHSPFQEQISNIHATALPAAARFCLWRKKPLSTTSEPDFVFTINFR